MNLSGINPLRHGTIGVAGIVILIIAALLVPQVAFDAGTTEFNADLSNASGLSSDAQVFVSGVPSGRVTDMALAGDHVRVTFRLDNSQQLGNQSTAEVKLQTVLGRRYLAVNPSGATPMASGGTIPVSRTTVPYNIGALGRDLVGKTNQLNADSQKRMIDTLNTSLPHDPQLIGDALQGISGVSTLLAKRNDQFQQLLRGAKSATDVLVGQRDNLAKLLQNAQIAADFIISQRDAINTLLNTVTTLIAQLNGLLKDNKAQVTPLLDNLSTLFAGLRKHKDLLNTALTNFAPSVRYLTNASGNGPWIDVSGPGILLPDNVLCLAGLNQGCK